MILISDIARKIKAITIMGHSPGSVRRLLAIGCLLWATGAMASPGQDAAINALILDQDRQLVTMSADGQMLISISGGNRPQMRISLASTDLNLTDKLPSGGTPTSLSWIDSGNLLLIWQYSALSQGFLLITIEKDAASGPNASSVTVRELYRHEHTRASAIQLVSLTANHVYYSLDERGNGSPGLFRIDWKTAHQRPYRGNPGRLIRWFHHPQTHTLMGWFWQVRDGVMSYELKVLYDGAGLWQSVIAYDLMEPEIRVIGFTDDGHGVIVAREMTQGGLPSGATSASDNARTQAAVSRISFNTAGAGDPVGTVDMPMRRVLLNQSGNSIDYLETNGIRPHSQARTERWQQRLDLLRAHDAEAFPVYLIDSANRDRSLWRLEYAHRSPAWVVLDQDQSRVLPVLESRYSGSASSLRQTRQIRARDGLILDTYVSLPERSQAGPAAAVMLVHGGPWFRDDWRFRREVEYLRRHGLAVIQVNFRGSRGLGHELFVAGREQWGRGMQTDLEDVLQNLVADGVVDPDRVCIMGNSYGGYAALMAVMRQNHPFRCAVAYAPVSDLSRQIRSFRSQYHYRAWHEWQAMVGVVGDRNSPLLQDPLGNAENLDVPVLVVHGTADHRVGYQQSQLLVNELERHGKNFQFIPIEGGQHNLINPQNRLHYYQKAITFLSQQLTTGNVMPAPHQALESHQ